MKPAIVQDSATGRVLMLAWMDEEAERLTRETNEAWFWSRSRERLWRKGETSGNTLAVDELRDDCDGDAILLRVTPGGPDVPHRLDHLLRAGALAHDLGARARAARRARTPPRCSTQGVGACARKVGEEAVELVGCGARRDATSGSSRRRPTSCTTSTCCSRPAGSTSPGSRTSFACGRPADALLFEVMGRRANLARFRSRPSSRARTAASRHPCTLAPPD